MGIYKILQSSFVALFGISSSEHRLCHNLLRFGLLKLSFLIYKLDNNIYDIFIYLYIYLYIYIIYIFIYLYISLYMDIYNNAFNS